MVGNFRFPSKFWWFQFRSDPYKNEHVMNEFKKREPLMGQPNFFSKFSGYSYLSKHDWSYPEEDHPYNPNVLQELSRGPGVNHVAKNLKGYIPNLSDF